MGKRAPQPGAKYRKRATIGRALPVASDRQLVAAQHFNDRVQNWLAELEQCNRFPLNSVEPLVVERVIEATSLLQGVVIEGIADYLLREEPPA